MRLSQTEVLERAERLAAALAGGETRVERNVLLAVVADFMADREPDLVKLRRTLELLAQGSGGHLRRGGSSYPAQIRTVTAELAAILDAETLESEDYRSLFGWTARLLLVRGLDPPRKSGTAPEAARVGGAEGRGGPARPVRRAPDRPAAPRTPPRGTLGAVSAKGLDALQQVKQRLAEREKPEDEK
jgi:hypothetical protein